jgi:hypothetical protein
VSPGRGPAALSRGQAAWSSAAPGPEQRGTVPRSAFASAPTRAMSSTWAMLLKRVFEVDPLSCPECGGVMKVISFIECGQSDVVERILRHCGLWEGPIRTLACTRPPPRGSVPDPDEPRELQLVLDPEYL